jgi:hypothetical protein
MDLFNPKAYFLKSKRRVRNSIYVFFSITGIMLFQRCDPNTQIICTDESVAGLSITVKDGNTNNYLIDSVTIVIHDGNYQETLQSSYNYYEDPFAGAYERPGNYQIITSKSGYKNDTSYANVTENQCHVIPVNKTIKLYP